MRPNLTLILHKKILKQLEVLAKHRGIEVQEYIRVIVIPEHLQSQPKSKDVRYSLRAKRSWETRRKNQEEAELRAKNEEFPPVGIPQ
jgi:hypothetical protein